jgi:hypothetical protein
LRRQKRAFDRSADRGSDSFHRAFDVAAAGTPALEQRGTASDILDGHVCRLQLARVIFPSIVSSAQKRQRMASCGCCGRDGCLPAPDWGEVATGECRVACPIVGEAACEACVPTCGSSDGGVVDRFGAAAREMVADTTSARYVMACFTYFIYAVCIVLIDIYSFGGYVSSRRTVARRDSASVVSPTSPRRRLTRSPQFLLPLVHLRPPSRCRTSTTSPSTPVHTPGPPPSRTSSTSDSVRRRPVRDGWEAEARTCGRHVSAPTGARVYRLHSLYHLPCSLLRAHPFRRRRRALCQRLAVLVGVVQPEVERGAFV